MAREALVVSVGCLQVIYGAPLRAFWSGRLTTQDLFQQNPAAQNMLFLLVLVFVPDPKSQHDGDNAITFSLSQES